MRITWYGHAAFLIETEGLRIILDPYRSPDSGGYEPIAEPADLVVVSHENDRYHSHLGQIVPPFETIRALELPPEGSVFRGIRFEAIHVFETPERLPEDEVTIVHFRSEGLHVVFLGDLGHPLSEGELAPLRGADVVLAAAGGPPTIDCRRSGRPARRHRPANRDPDALQDAQDQPEHRARSRSSWRRWETPRSNAKAPARSRSLEARCPGALRSSFLITLAEATSRFARSTGSPLRAPTRGAKVREGIEARIESTGHQPRRSDMPLKKCVAAAGVCAFVCSAALLGLRSLDAAQHEKAEAAGVTHAIAQMHPTSGSSVKGKIAFTKVADGIHVHAEISGLTPGEHGFHIHEYGVWSEDGMSSGGHFNPTMAQHAGIDSKKRHVGDLGNITANSNGHATLDVDDAHLSFHGASSILGRGVVVHEKADDLKSQPAGAAGARLAVGVVGVAKP